MQTVAMPSRGQNFLRRDNLSDIYLPKSQTLYPYSIFGGYVDMTCFIKQRDKSVCLLKNQPNDWTSDSLESTIQDDC